VAIYHNDGSLVEQGNAVAGANGVDWVYKAASPPIASSQAINQSNDLP
jgi:hypothetical protein